MTGAPKTLLLIHHSHTDVGYTDQQSVIARRHADFLRQALAILRSDVAAADGAFTVWRWNCETFWAVEQFLEIATPAEVRAFEDAVRNGTIGLSASYLNLSELPDLPLLRAVTRRATDYGQSIGVRVDSAMTADINGHGWGFARALADAGVENLFACVHTHHGRYPLDRPQRSFWWEAPGGERILVTSGDHYHLGNELGLAPGAAASYLTKDECDAEMIFHDARAIAEIRIPRFWERLVAAGHGLDFAPMMISGLRTDNGPPSAAIAEQVRWWNERHGDRYPAEMVTLSEYFGRLRDAAPDLPVHRGDWPDWWSDGPAGNPAHTRLFREAQRGLAFVRRLAEAFPEVPEPAAASVENDLALYGEHTFSHSESVREPWHLQVHAISERKKAYAARAYDEVARLRDEAARSLGGVDLRPDAPLLWEAVNPEDHPVTGLVRLPVGHYEFHERGFDRGGAIRDVAAGELLATRGDQVPGAMEYRALVTLGPRERRRFELLPGASMEESSAAPADWRGLVRGDAVHAPFQLVHEITPMEGPGDACAVRGAMGLDRKGEEVVRSAAELIETKTLPGGPVLARREQVWRCPGTRSVRVRLAAYRDASRVDVSVRIHKESRWEPENLYLSLPFAPGSGSGELWVGKAGTVLRPRQDQIPGTLTDYYALQAGFVVTDGDFGVAVAVRDANLLQVGPLDPGPRLLAGDPDLDSDRGHLYSWLMTNFWETNFAAELGGFHEFRYSVLWGPELADPERAIRACGDANRDIFCVRLAGP